MPSIRCELTAKVNMLGWQMMCVAFSVRLPLYREERGGKNSVSWSGWISYLLEDRREWVVGLRGR